MLVKAEGVCIVRVGLVCMIGMALTLSAGCGSLATRAAADASNQITRGIQAQNDLTLVATGLPAYLMAADGLVIDNPKNANVLFGVARLQGLYGTYFVAEPERRKNAAAKSLQNARRGWCVVEPQACDIDSKSYSEFEHWLEKQSSTNIDNLYVLGNALATWIQANSAELGEIAKLAYVDAIFRRIVEMDEGYDYGNAIAALGVLNALVPAAMGGHPSLAQRHFERSLQIAGDRNLMPKVLYARHYARMVFDKELHDRLLKEILEAPTDDDTFRLSNALARREAKLLLANADEYF